MRARELAPFAPGRAGAPPQIHCQQGASRVPAVCRDAVRHLHSHPAHSGRVTALPGSANAQCWPLCLFPHSAKLSKMPCNSASFAVLRPALVMLRSATGLLRELRSPPSPSSPLLPSALSPSLCVTTSALKTYSWSKPTASTRSKSPCSAAPCVSLERFAQIPLFFNATR